MFQLFPRVAWAQNSNTTHVSVDLTLPPVALIGLATVDQQIISHSFSFSSNQVQQVITKTNVDQTWLNYSSVVSTGNANYITANISSGFLPSDVLLHVSVGSPVGSGKGALGTPVGIITLTHDPQNLIVNIGSCYTGVGANNGRLINYSWDNPESYDYYLNYQHGKPISVTYTITSH